MSAAPFLARMQQNVAIALSEGATVTDVLASILAVTRGTSKPTESEVTDAAEVAELVDVLNEFRTGAPS